MADPNPLDGPLGKLARLSELQQQFVVALIMEDTARQDAIRAEFKPLYDSYMAERSDPSGSPPPPAS